MAGNWIRQMLIVASISRVGTEPPSSLAYSSYMNNEVH